MNETYRAIEVSKPGVLTQVRKPLVDPGPNQVRIRVEACGVCHSDSATVDGLFPISYPRVPGHEVVGRIDMVGDGVRGWTVGPARRRRISRCPLWLVRILLSRRSRELPEPGVYGRPQRRRLCRGDDRESQWADVDSTRA